LWIRAGSSTPVVLVYGQSNRPRTHANRPSKSSSRDWRWTSN